MILHWCKKIIKNIKIAIWTLTLFVTELMKKHLIYCRHCINVKGGIRGLCVNLFSFWWQERFTQDMQPHYIYSPREMTRWVRGICEALKPLETLSIEGLVRLWAHEALRLFQDRWGFWVFCNASACAQLIQTWYIKHERPHLITFRDTEKIVKNPIDSAQWSIFDKFRAVWIVLSVWCIFSFETKRKEKMEKQNGKN